MDNTEQVELEIEVKRTIKYWDSWVVDGVTPYILRDNLNHLCISLVKNDWRIERIDAVTTMQIPRYIIIAWKEIEKEV